MSAAANPADRRALWGAVAAVGSTSTAGAALVFARFAVAEVEPLTLTLLRMAIALAVIAPLALVTRSIWPRGRDLVLVAALGIALFAFGQWLILVALTMTTAAHSAIIFSTMPVMALLASAALGIERLTLPRSGGVALATAGVVVAMGGSAASLPGSWRGDLIMLGTTVLYVAYNFAARGVSRRCTPLAFITASMAPAVLVLVAVVAATGTPLLTIDPSTDVWGAILLIGIVGGAGSYGLYLVAIRLTTPTRVAIAVTASPLAAILCGAAVLGEPVGPATLAGFAGVAAGVLLVNLPQRQAGGASNLTGDS